MQTWKGKLLSLGGKYLLLNVVALAISMFVMSCFKLPTNLCFELESLITNLWWDRKENEKKIHWIGWDKVCLSKFKGGLGFKKLSTFNLALLAKQGCRIYHNENSLLHKIYKARYFRNNSFLTHNWALNCLIHREGHGKPRYGWKNVVYGE